MGVWFHFMAQLSLLPTQYLYSFLLCTTIRRINDDSWSVDFYPIHPLAVQMKYSFAIIVRGFRIKPRIGNQMAGSVVLLSFWWFSSDFLLVTITVFMTFLSGWSLRFDWFSCTCNNEITCWTYENLTHFIK